MSVCIYIICVIEHYTGLFKNKIYTIQNKYIYCTYACIYAYIICVIERYKGYLKIKYIQYIINTYTVHIYVYTHTVHV